jgi:hypothetical protein
MAVPTNPSPQYRQQPLGMDGQCGNHLGGTPGWHSTTTWQHRWLHHRNFYEVTHRLDAAVAHKLADCCLSHNTTLHSQQIKGTRNVVADALSCQFGLSDAQLTTYCHKHFPLQLPQDFQIISGISCTIALTRSLNRPLPSVQETGRDGLSIWESSAYSSTHSSTTSCSGKDKEWLNDSFVHQRRILFQAQPTRRCYWKQFTMDSWWEHQRNPWAPG